MEKRWFALFLAVSLLTPTLSCSRINPAYEENNTNSSRVNNTHQTLPVSNLRIDVLDKDKGNDFDKSLILRSEVASPKGKDGKALQSTSIKASGNTIVISYNTQGEIMEGAIDLARINENNTITILDTYVFPNMDINDLEIKDNTVYFTGAVTEVGYTGAFWGKIDLKDNKFKGDTFVKYQISGFAGTCLKIKSNKIHVTSGTNGEFGIYKQDGSLDSKFSNADVRYLSCKSKNYILRGNGGILDDKGSVIYEYSGQTQSDNKLSIFEGPSQMLYLALGKVGVKAFDIKTKAVITYSHPSDSPVTDTTAANSVLSKSGYLFVSYGGSGVYLTNSGTSYKWFAKLSDGSSVNHIYSKSKMLYVAVGSKGIKAIELDKFDISEDDDDDDN